MTADAFARTHAQAFAAGGAWSSDTLARYLGRDTTLIGGDSDSFVLGTCVADEAEILTVATAKALQRQGKASAALQDFITQAQDRGARRIFLEVAADNAAAQALYAKAGFRQVGLRQNYYARSDGTRCDALVLQCDLPQR